MNITFNQNRSHLRFGSIPQEQQFKLNPTEPPFRSAEGFKRNPNLTSAEFLGMRRAGEALGSSIQTYTDRLLYLPPTERYQGFLDLVNAVAGFQQVIRLLPTLVWKLPHGKQLDAYDVLVKKLLK